MRAWVKRISKGDQPWRVGDFEGPRQLVDDVNFCGELVAFVLRAWIRGHAADSGSPADPLKLIVDVLDLLPQCPREPALPTTDGTHSPASGAIARLL